MPDDFLLSTLISLTNSFSSARMFLILEAPCVEIKLEL